MSNQFRITLIRSKDDSSLENKEYQSAIREFSSQLPTELLVQKISFAMDSSSADGGSLGEFILMLTQYLAPVLCIAAAGRFRTRSGRKIRIQCGKNMIKVDNSNDLEIAVKGFNKIQAEIHVKEAGSVSLVGSRDFA